MDLRFAGLAFFAVAAFAACGGGSDQPSGSGTTTATTSTTTGGEGGAGGSIGVGGSTGTLGAECVPACVAPQKCSVAGTCIDPGTCAADGDCDKATVCDKITGKCVPGGGCGAQETKIEAVPPNLLVVLDRSCSMTDKVGATTKWAIAVDAINKMTMTQASKIRFGLTLFPDLVTPDCAQGAIPLPTAPGNEAAIQMLLTKSLVKTDKYFPDAPCVTNIDAGMQQAATDPALDDMTRQSYLLLLTDGQQSACNTAGGDAGTTKIITNLFKKRNIATFVIGFGTGVDPAQMNIFATAGGVPNADPAAKYYKAEDQASLDAALTEISEKTLSCTYKLDAVPPSPDQIFVFLNNNPVGLTADPTHTSSWDYDAMKNQVTFYGSTCAEIKSGTVTDLDIVFGCNMPTPD